VRRVVVAALLCGLLCGVAPTGRPRSATASAQGARATDRLQARLDEKVRRNRGFGGGVLRMSSGADGVLFEGTSGRLFRGSRVRMRPRYTFEIASTTKTVTAVAVLLLVEDGVIGLDDPIGSHLPSSVTTGLLVVDGHDYGPEITVRQLLGHTGGLPDYWNDPPYLYGTVNAFLDDFLRRPDHFFEPGELIGYAKELTPIAVPGTRYHYCDTGYVLLGMLVETVTGRRLHRVFRRRLFRPLGMADTYMSYREPAVSRHRESHRYEARHDLYGETRQSADWAGGGLVSSTRDLERFVRALFGGRVFRDPATLESMRGWGPTGVDGVEYGLGLFRVVLAGRRGELWGHDGYGNAWMYYWPKEDVTFVGTLNQTRNDWWGLVATGIRLVDRGAFSR
jgi:D-alanyl-D-alanine carboxypeptidase